jgi:hypothetical protein
MKKIFNLFLIFGYCLLSSIEVKAQAHGDFRSIATGTFSDVAIWETYNVSTSVWEPALGAPTGTSSISIQVVHEVTLDDNVVMSTNKNFTVNGTVICSTYYIQGTTGCTFVLGAGATLSTGNANGILSTTIATIRSFSTNSFHSAANYIFNGSSNQNINPSNTTFNHLTIQTTGGASVALSAGKLLTLNGTLTLTSGLFNMFGTLTLAGTPIAGTATNLVTNNNSTLKYVTSQSGQFIPSSVTNLGGLYLDAGANSLITLNSNLIIANSQGLHLVNGILHCGSFTVSVSSNGAAGGNIGSYVQGTLLIALPFTSSAMNYVFPVGGATFNPLSITLAASLTTNTTLAVSVIDGVPIGTEDLSSLNGGMSDRYWRLKMTGIFNVSEVSSIQVGTLGISPSINTTSAIAFSTSNTALSYHSSGGIIGTDLISSGNGLTSAQFADLGSSDGSFVGISNRIPLTAGIYCVGPAFFYNPPSGPAYINVTSPFSNLTAAIFALNTRGTTGHIVFELQNNYVSTNENNSMALTYQGNVNATAIFKVRSDLTAPLLIAKTGILNIGILDFNGGDYITMDGTIGNASCGSGYGIILRDVGGGTCIGFRNDAQNNTIKGVQIEMGGTSGIFMEYLNGSIGNDYNSFSCNKFQLRSDIVSTASVTGFVTRSNIGFSCKNDHIWIDQNKFENCASGIQVGGGGNYGLWTITNNHFYKTTATSAISAFIHVQMLDTGKVVIEGNYFGGSAPLCLGSKMLISSGSSLLNLSLPSTSVENSSFSNNIIQNITSSSNLTLTQFSGLPIHIENNILGNPSVPNDITVGSGFGFIGYSGYNGSNSIRIHGNSVNNISIPNNNGNSCTLLNFSSTGNQVKNISNNSFKNIYTGNSTFYGIQINTSNGGGNISHNVLENIHQTNVSANVSNPFHIQGPDLNVVGNRIGSLANANDMEFENVVQDVFYVASHGNSIIDSNVIANVNLNNTGLISSKVLNYFSVASSTRFITNNILKNVKTKSAKSDAESNLGNSSLIGIYLNIQSMVQVSNNRIDELHAANSAAISSGVIGVFLSSNASSNISNNHIYHLKNEATGISPLLIGLYHSGTLSTVSNNMIALSNSTNTNGVKIVGIRLAGFVGSRNIYHNTVSIAGTSSGALNSYALYKENNGTNSDNIKNNIFSNVRTGSGNHFAIAHATGITNQWATSDYNNLYTANANTLGEWPLGTSKSFATWKSTSAKDVNSLNVLTTFIDVDNDLHLNQATNCFIHNQGTILSITTDIDNDMRNVSWPDLGADEFDYDSTWANTTSNTPVCGPNDALILQSVATNGFTPFTYSWFGPNAFTSSMQNPIVNAPTDSLHTGTYQVTITDNFGCTATSTTMVIVNDAQTWYYDEDEDGYSYGNSIISCTAPGAHYTTSILGTNDCSDENAATHPNAIEICGNTIDDDCDGQVDEGCSTPATLNLKVYLQGCYLEFGLMNDVLYYQGEYANPSSIADSITIELHEAVSPYHLAFQTKQALPNDGALVLGGLGVVGLSYYIVVKHRNSIETWSANPITFSSSTNYDFTTASSQAYGNNQHEVESGIFALYSGDINQDQAIDAFDYLLQDPDIILGAFGYMDTDLNGDGTVDAFDYILLDANLIAGISTLAP